MTPPRRWLVHIGVVAALLALAAAPVDAGDEDCVYYPPDIWAPEGTQGCTLDGPTEGVASTWGGPVTAAQWCTYPWQGCTSVRVQSHQTGLAIVVTPEQFCHCFWMTDRRLVDLTYEQVRALGLNPEAGIFRVTVTPFREALAAPMLPDTATE